MIVREKEEGNMKKLTSVKIPLKTTTAKVLLIYPTLISEAPITLAMLASVMQKEGFTVSALVNTFRRPLGINDYVSAAKEFGADVVGIRMLTYNVLNTYKIINALKREGLTVLVGGPHATDRPEEVINYGADIVIRNEGEDILRDICQYWNGRDGLSLETIGGITYRDVNGKICSTATRPILRDLAELPPPDLDVFDIDLFRQSDGLIKGFHRIYTSRGCPGRCTYCDLNVFGQKLRFWPVSAVIDEIKNRIEKYGITSFTIVDDCFTVSHKRVYEFCEQISKVSPKVVWRVNSRANLVNRQMLQAMKEAGCHLIIFGLESGDPETLRKVKKDVKLEDNINAPIIAAEAGMQVHANLMTGFPWETVESVNNNVKLIHEIRDAVYLYQVSGSLIPFPGAEIYNQYADIYGFRDYWLDDQYQEVGIQTYQNNINPYKSSTFYQRYLFDDRYIQEETFFNYSQEYKEKVWEMVYEIGRHNLETLYAESPLKQAMILFLSKISSKIYKLSPKLEMRLGGLLYRPRKGKRSNVEGRMDMKRGFVRNREDVVTR